MEPTNQQNLIKFRGVPHIGTQIFEELDNQSLTKCREVCKSWQELIDNRNIPWKRILMKFPSGEGMYIVLTNLLSTYSLVRKKGRDVLINGEGRLFFSFVA